MQIKRKHMANGNDRINIRIFAEHDMHYGVHTSIGW